MAIKKFNSIDGFSVGSDTPIAVIDNVANVTANSLVVSNKSNLGNVGNITITGGSAGYVLKTDGTGNLSWGIDTAAAGGSNTQIQFNDGGSLNGNSNFTFNKSTSVLTLTGNLVTTNANLGNLAVANYFSGNGSYLTSIAGSNVSGQVGNALVAGTVYTNAQPNITSVGTLNTLAVTATVTAGNAIIGLGTGGNITGANLISANYFSGNGSLLTTITGANVSGNVTYAITSNWANTANSVPAANITGQVANALVAGTVYTAAQPNITSVGTLTSLSVTGNASVGNLSGANTINANYFTGIITTTHQPNIESLGDLVGLKVSNISGLVDFNTTANVSLGNISNLHISGGSAGYVLTTDGYGDLSWEAAGSGSGSGFVSIRKDNFTGNGVQTQFSLSAVPSGEDSVEVNLNGLIQQGYVYNVVGSNVVFTTAPASGANIEITTFGALAINQTDSQILFISGSNLVGSNNFTFTESNNTLSVNNVSATANVSAGNVKTDNLLYANGSPYVFTTSASGSNTQVQFNDSNSFAGSAAFTFNKGTNTLSVTNIVANGSGITYITGSNVSGNVNSAVQSHYANIANSVAGANVTGQVGNALVAGTVYTAAQPNITSVGTLSSLTIAANGNITMSGSLSRLSGANLVSATYLTGTLTTAAQPNITSVGNLTSLTVTGNVSANYFIGNGSQLTGLPTQYSNTNVAAYLPTYTGNVSANYFIGNGSTLTYITGANVTGYVPNANIANSATTAGTVTTNAQPNITSVGTLSSLVVSANVTAGNAIIGLGTGGNITGANLIGSNYFSGNGSLLTFITGSNVSGNVNSAVQSHYANIANSVSGSNVTGQVGNALVAGTVYTNAQPNITSVGTLTSLSVTGNVSANYFIGNGSQLTNINISNIAGSYSNSNVASYLPTYTGNVSANYFIGNGSTLTNITGSNVSGNVTSAVQSHYANIANSVAGANVTGQVGNALIAGTVYTAAQPNITSVGTLLGLSVTGNLNITGNIIATGNLNYSNVTDLIVGDPLIYLGANNTGNLYDLGFVASYNDGAYYHTGLARDASDGTWKLFDTVVAEPTTTIDFANGTYAPFKSGAILSTGNISGINANLGNLVVANYFSGDGSLLTNINAGNITGAYSNTNVAAYLPTYTGNVSANYFIGNGSALTFITGANIVGNVTYAITSNWANTANSVSGTNVSGNVADAVHAYYADVANSVTGANVSGNVNYAITSNWANTANSISGSNVSGNVNSAIQAQYANIANSVSGSNVSGNVDYAITSNWANTANNISGTNVSGNVNFAITSNWANVANSVLGTNVSGNVSNAVHAYYADVANSVAGSNVTGQVGNALVAGTVYTNAQPNITSVGTLTSLSVSGNVSANYFIGDGSLLTNINAGNITGAYSNTNVAAYLPTYTGNVSANYFIGNGSALTDITGSNVIGNVTFAITSNWANTANSVSGSNVSGNVDSAIQAQYANIANSVAGSNVSGNVDYAITSNWANTANSILGSNVSGNVDFAITSNWANVANSVTGSNVSGQVGNALIAGTVYTNAQPNITSLGSLSNLTVAGDATITGNLTVSGNTNYINVDTLVVQDPIIEMGGGANGAPLTTNDGKDRGSLLHYYTTSPVDAFMGWDNSNAEFAFGSNVSVTNEVVTINDLGNIRAGYFIGNGALLTGLPAQYANSNVANYLPTYTGNVSANYFIGNGSTLTDITGSNVIGNVTFAITSNWANVANSVAGSNVSGQVGNASIAGTVYTNAQPNITSVGTLSSLSVTGNITSSANSYAKLFGSSSTTLAVPGPGNVTGERVRLYDFGSPSSTNYAIGVEDHYIWTAVDATTAGFKWYGGNTLAATLIANGQFTTVGSINSANANLGNLVVANYFSGDGSLLTNINAGNITGSYGNANVAEYLPTYTGNVSANYFIGNGSTLTDITGSNVIGNVTYAITSNWANVANSIAGANVSGNVDSAIQSQYANIANSVSGSNVSGNVADAVHAYYADIANSVSGSNVSGNVDFAITSNWSNVANSVSGSNVSGTVANATYATSAGSADSANTAGTVTTAAQPNITSTGTLTGLTVDGLTDLGPIGNITITGGTAGYVLTTNGSGDLSWQAAGGSTGPGFVNITKNSFTGNGVQTVFTLTTTPASEASLLVNIDGITQQDSAYSLTGSNVTFASAPFSGEIVEIVTYGSIGIGSNTTVLFNDNGDIGNVAAFSFNKGSNTLSVTNIDTSSISFDAGVITVAGANAGIFTSGVDNINLGLGANVTVGSTSGNTTIQGNLIAGNISTSSNLSITGTATISNLKVNDLYSNRAPVSVTTNTIVDSFPINRYRSAKYTMRVNSDDGYQAVEVLLIHDGSTSYVTIYGSLSTIGTDIVTLSSNILSGSVRLLATTASANTTVNLLGTYVAD